MYGDILVQNNVTVEKVLQSV